MDLRKKSSKEKLRRQFSDSVSGSKIDEISNSNSFNENNSAENSFSSPSRRPSVEIGAITATMGLI